MENKDKITYKLQYKLLKDKILNEKDTTCI